MQKTYCGFKVFLCLYHYKEFLLSTHKVKNNNFQSMMLVIITILAKNNLISCISFSQYCGFLFRSQQGRLHLPNLTGGCLHHRCYIMQSGLIGLLILILIPLVVCEEFFHMRNRQDNVHYRTMEDRNIVTSTEKAEVSLC